MKPTVFLALPTYNRQLDFGTALAALVAPSQGKLNVRPVPSMNSLLCHGFNGLWCSALNERAERKYQYFAMLHADVAPEPFWLDMLVEELEQAGVDLVSAVVPIKNDHGLTSTALDVRNDASFMPRRLTLTEVHDLPQTFTAADTQHPDSPLVVNTGCWVCRFDREWNEKVCFDDKNYIVKTRDGKFHAVCQPEDWDFSRQLHALGVPIAATRRVELSHYGTFAFTNEHAWGRWATDETFANQEASAFATASEERQTQDCVAT